MSNARADSSNVEQLKKLLTKLGTVLLQSRGSTETLLKNLDRLELLLSHVLQEYKEQLEMLLQQIKESLIASELIRHSELDVRVSVASCISQIIRITAPDEPYGEDHMKEFFQLAISAFERLSCMSGRVYLKAVSILKALSHSQACVMMLDLELDTAIDLMFHLFLDGIRTSHPKDVFSNMENIMTLIIRNTVDDDDLLFVLVKIILNRLRRENQNVSPVSFQLAENTFKNFSGDLKAYLPEAVRCLDFPIEDYAEVVVSFFQDATQRDNTNFSEKGQGSSTEAATIEKSRGKTIPSADLKQDSVFWQTLTSQCRLASSKAKALSGKVSKSPKGSTPHLGKRTEIGSAPEKLIGCRIKVWWPLDRKFYKGKIAGFDREVKLHMVDYDDGEIEFLDLTRECWEMLPGSKLSGHDKEIDADSSSSKSKKE